MTSYFITITILTLFFSLLFVVSMIFHWKKSNSWTITGLTISIIGSAVIIIGFWLIKPLTTTTYYKVEPINVTITKSPTQVFVEIPKEGTIIFSLKSEYEDIDSTTQFYQIKKYDYYNSSNGTSISYDKSLKGKTVVVGQVDDEIVTCDRIIKQVTVYSQ